MKKLTPRPASYTKKVALVMQGGGALGSYQAGAYEAFASSDYQPDWVAGVSIGAINAALIAGNAPGKRVEKLRKFWQDITISENCFDQFMAFGQSLNLKALPENHASALYAIFMGQPEFFSPRDPSEWWFGGSPTSYYDTSALKSTLERLVDFDRINAGKIRFSVGAVNVRTGNFAYFDNTDIKITPEHIMASGALPPGFPSIEIDGEYYWDGGLVSNTPLQYVIEHSPRHSHLIFQIDVFPARGALPEDMYQVNERIKDIRFSSRTRAVTDNLRSLHNLRHNINTLWEKLPDELRATREARFLYNFSCVTTMDIVHLIYRPEHPQGQSKDYEFDRAKMETRWKNGFTDAMATLVSSPWLAPAPAELGVRTFDVQGPSPAANTPVKKRRKASEKA